MTEHSFQAGAILDENTQVLDFCLWQIVLINNSSNLESVDPWKSIPSSKWVES